MSTTQQRRLVAILFADIQEYTALMRDNEEIGRLVLRNFRDTLTEQVAAYDGQIINFYGDGCLCVFDDPVAAVNCAGKVQGRFKKATPQTSVRIGLHRGEVAFEDGNAYGDSVNLTSRIESFGVPGSVLLSHRLKQDIANKTDYRPTSLGSFKFKNVNQPMQVYALQGKDLVVPDRAKLKGKGKVLPSTASKIKKWAWAGIAVALLIALKFFTPLGKLGSPIPKSLRESRIAVLPFENKTGIAELDIVGDMASDWIIQGLMYLDDIQLVGFESIMENIQYASMEDSSQNFARRTGAQKLVQGRYYISGEDLIFQSQIIDIETGKIELTLPKVIGPRDDNAALVSELQEKFVTAFDAQNHEFSPGIAQNPPPHKAYQLFREGIDIYSEDAAESRILFAQAIEMDSSFFWPYIWATASFFNAGRNQEADSTFALIKKKIDFKSLNGFDRQWYLHWQALLDKDLKKAFKASLKILERDPKQWFSNVEAGIIANNLNMPQKAVEIFEYMDLDYAPQNIELDTWWHNYFAHNLYRLGRYEAAQEVINAIQPKFRKYWNYYDRLAEIYVQQGKDEELLALIQIMQDNQLANIEILNEYLFIAQRFGILQQTEKQKAWAQKGIDWANQQGTSIDPFVLGSLYYTIEQFNIAKPLFQEAVETAGPTWLNLSRLALTNHELGQRKTVQTLIQQLETLYTDTQDAGYLVAQAHIYSALGDKNKATSLLKRATKKGFAYSPTTLGNDIMLVDLQGYPAFEAITKPKALRLAKQ